MAPNLQPYNSAGPVSSHVAYDGHYVSQLDSESTSDTNLRDDGILTKAQLALKQQLLERKQDLEERLREKGFVLKAASKKREDSGVKLYGLQKTLATLHMSLKSANERLAVANVEHLKADEELIKTQKLHKEKQTELGILEEKMENYQQELNNLGETLQQIESHNEKLKGHIAVSRRTTYATEEHILKAEKEKKDQDFLIAQFQHQIKHQLEKQALCQARLIGQERETKVARIVLTEAGIEMESINSEKKQITTQWKSSLVVLARCDEALQALRDAIREQKDQEIAIEGEKHSLKKAIQKEHDKAEQQVASITALESRIKSMQRQSQQTVTKRLKFLEDYAKHLFSMNDAEGNQEKSRREIVRFQEEIKVIEGEILRESRTLTELEDKMIKSLSEQVTVERSHQKLVQRTLEARQQAKIEDMIVTELEFELAQIRNDVYKVQCYNQNVRDVLAALDLEAE